MSHVKELNLYFDIECDSLCVKVFCNVSFPLKYCRVHFVSSYYSGPNAIRTMHKVIHRVAFILY